MEEVLDAVGDAATLVTIYPFDSCPSEPPAAAPAHDAATGVALPPAGDAAAGEAPGTVQLVDDPSEPVAEAWGRYPGSVFLVERGGRIVYKRTRLVRDEVVRLLAGGPDGGRR